MLFRSMYSFWNDAIYLSNDITVIHRSSNSNKMFSITDYLLPGKKSSASHFPVIEENLQKNDFSVVGTASCSDPTSAFSYSLSIQKCGKIIYSLYEVSSPVAKNLEPGISWERYVQTLRSQKKASDAAVAKVMKENAKSMEVLYKGIFAD